MTRTFDRELYDKRPESTNYYSKLLHKINYDVEAECYTEGYCYMVVVENLDFKRISTPERLKLKWPFGKRIGLLAAPFNANLRDRFTVEEAQNAVLWTPTLDPEKIEEWMKTRPWGPDSPWNKYDPNNVKDTYIADHLCGRSGLWCP